jgi:four helix bundle protein
MARDYTKIKAWQLADELALLVYKATREFPKSEIWGLTSQMRRAAVSVPANIVEGSARRKRNEYLQFSYIAMSSLAELNYYVRFTNEIGYLGTNKKPRPQGAALESKFLNPKPRSRNKFGMTKRREPNPLVMLLNVIEKSGV